MAYKKETIQKLLRTGKELIDHFMNMSVSDLILCISHGNAKIGRTLNVSLPPIFACGNCKHCMPYCYDVKACARFTKTTFAARIRNWVLLIKDRDAYFAQIEKALRPRIRNKYFRWHVAGDIIDADYLERMIGIAIRHPDWTFWTYTKMYDLVNEYCRTHGGKSAVPKNLTIMFSEWDGVEMPNPYDFPIFAVKMKGGNKNHDDAFFDTLYRCPGNCDICKKLHRGCLAGENTYNEEH